MNTSPTNYKRKSYNEKGEIYSCRQAGLDSDDKYFTFFERFAGRVLELMVRGT